MADGASTGHLVDNHASRAKWSFPWAGRTRDERSQAWLDTLERLDKLQGDRIPEYDAAIRSSSVTLQQIVEGRHRLCEDSRTNEKSSPISSEYEELLWLAYQHARGEIVRYYFSSDQRAAVVLVKPHKDKSHKNKAMDLDLDLFYPIEELAHLTPQFEATLWTCISQFHRIAEVDLDIKGRYEVFHELYLIVVYLFVVLESQQAYHQNQYRHVLSRAKQILGFVLGRTRRGPGQEPSDAATVHTPDISPTPLRVNAKVIEDFIGERIKITERIKEALDQANNHLCELEETIGQFATREARGVYIRAMLPGSLFVLVPAAVYVGIIFRLGASYGWTTEKQVAWYLVAIAVTTGALGAVVSVILRAADQPRNIDYHAGRQLIKLNGRFRPIVGAVFGLVFYILINAGLLQVLAAPQEIGARAFFIAATSFVAGFSERRAQDVILRAVPTGDGTEAPAGKSPARRPEEARIP